MSRLTEEEVKYLKSILIKERDTADKKHSKMLDNMIHNIEYYEMYYETMAAQ